METPEGMKLSIGKGKGGMDALRNSTVASAVSDIQNAESGVKIIGQIREIATADRVGTRGLLRGKTQNLLQQLTPESPVVTAARSEAAKLQGIAGATKAFERTFDAGIPASQALFEALAIVAANAIGLGSGGRLSDQDIERVYKIIGGSPDQLLQSPPNMNSALDVLENLLTSKAQQKAAMLQAVGAPPQSLGAKVPGQLPPPDKWGSMSTAERQKILDGTNGGTK